MITSGEIGELAGALSKFHGEVSDPMKGRQGYGYLYADLSDYLEAARPVMAKHGLALMQTIGIDYSQPGEATVRVTTLLAHSSGQWIKDVTPIVVEPTKNLSLAQSIGVAASYARKYSAAAALGLAQDDPDGDAENAGEPRKSKSTVKAAPKKPPAKPEQKPAAKKDAPTKERLSDKEVQTLTTLIEKAGGTVEGLCKKQGVQSLHDIPQDKLPTLITSLQAMVQQQEGKDGGA